MKKLQLSFLLISMGVASVAAEDIVYIIETMKNSKPVFLLLLVPVTIVEVLFLWRAGFNPKKLSKKQLNIMYASLNIAAFCFGIATMLTQMFISKTLGWVCLSLVATNILTAGAVQYRAYKSEIDIQKNN